MKSVLKYMFCLLAYYSGMVSLYRLLFSKKTALVLTYHRVLSAGEMALTFSQPGMIVSKCTFEKQICYLADAYRIVPLAEMAARLRSDRVDGNYCSITFDDGWRDVYTNAFPILTKESIPAVVFLSTGFINTGGDFWPERLTRALLSLMKLDCEGCAALVQIDRTCAEEAKRVVNAEDEKTKARLVDGLIEMLKEVDPETTLRFVAAAEGCFKTDLNAVFRERHVLSWSEVKDMRQQRIKFGSHTVNHSILTKIPSSVARMEIRESKKELKEKLGEEIDLFAYPNGDWNDEVREMVEEAGYNAAVTTRGWRNDPSTNPFLIGRLNVHEGMSVSPWGWFSRAVFACETSGILELLRRHPSSDRPCGRR